MWTSLVFFVGSLLITELAFWGLSRLQPRFKASSTNHLWAVFLAGFLAIQGTPYATDAYVAWKILCTGSVVLTVLAIFSLLDVFLVVRPVDTSSTEQEGRFLVPRLLYNVVRFLSVVAAGIFALTAIHKVPLPTVLVSSTVISAVLGLSLQDVLKNVFAGVSLELEGRVREGDWLMIDDQPAQVKSMSWRSTRLRTNLGVYLLEPNVSLASQRLLNYGSGFPPVAFAFRVGLPYEAPPAECRDMLLRAAKAVDAALSEPTPRALLRAYGASSIEYELRVWTQNLGQIEVFGSNVRSRMWYEIQRAGLSVPFPIRTVHMHQVDERQAKEQQEQAARLAAQLAKVDLFADLESSVLHHLAELARPLDFDDGEALTQEGEPGDSLFVLDRGRVMVSKSGQTIGTGTVQLASLGQGDVFGEMSLLTGEQRSATVRADGSCRVLVLSKQAVAPLLESEPKLAETFSRILAQRQAATVATFEARGSRPQTAEDSELESQTILRRIQRFFRLS